MFFLIKARRFFLALLPCNKQSGEQNLTKIYRGKHSEQIAEIYLKRQGLRLITRNFRRNSGEIDRIFWDDTTLVFVEIRSRHKGEHGNAIETVDQIKQQKIIKTAQLYLQQKGLPDNVDCRFDVIAITLNNQHPIVNWYKNAFIAR